MHLVLTSCAGPDTGISRKPMALETHSHCAALVENYSIISVLLALSSLIALSDIMYGIFIPISTTGLVGCIVY